ncbi:fatty-acid-binding protein 2-like [Quillaja saponaria]|uniref:Fatty-acid-binding protein 2-like n=1 Tax=Quillaja saponaria TaxID=32244 RepID=A0AAD7LJY6_QUISA|nr:fatty-acid-binding protein 2-like [Quillaja saponaria]
MKSNWLSSIDPDGVYPDIFSLEPFLLNNFGGHIFSQISSFVDNSVYQSRCLYVPGSLALQEAFSCFSKFAGALLVWFCSGSSSNITREIAGSAHNSELGSCKASLRVKNITTVRHNMAGFRFGSESGNESNPALAFGKMSSFAMKLLLGEARFQSYPVLSLAAALVPPFQNLSSKVLAVPLENTDVQVHGGIDQMPSKIENPGCARLSFPELNWTRHAVEPRTGIEFPIILDNILAGEKKSSLNSEVLVGTGSRTMTIVKIKSLKIYAFGFYVHPYSVCEKLGPKYASISADELNNCHDFYADLLREDIDMTVRLVVNCKGMKINTVRDAFEKSLRARLVKTNPNTDYHCLRTFGSCFTQDIPLPLGTIINFRRTADGQLITEIGGNQMGSVHSKDLCRAFFDMYIGDVPVSEQTKEEIGRNVANIIRRC